MSSRWIVTLAACCTMAVAGGSSVAAKVSGTTTPSGSVTASAEHSGGSVGDSGDGGAAVCRWSEVRSETYSSLTGHPVDERSGRALYLAAGGARVATRVEAEYVLYDVACPSGTRQVYYQLVEAIDRQAVIDRAMAEMTRILPLPSMDMWPRPEIGAPVQLGLGLAVEDPGDVVAYAQAGPVWAIVTAHLTSTRWDMGNGDAVDCAGAGVPYARDLEPTDYSEGPCGYTYRYVSDLGLRQITSTAHWDVQLATSDGADAALGSIDRSTAFDYEVYEIRIVSDG